MKKKNCRPSEPLWRELLRTAWQTLLGGVAGGLTIWIGKGMPGLLS